MKFYNLPHYLRNLKFSSTIIPIFFSKRILKYNLGGVIMNTTDKFSKENLIIYRKYIELVYYTNDILKKYPKSEKFALVSEIKQTLYTGLRNLLYAIKSFNKYDKLKYLKDLDMNLVLLKIHIRLSCKYQYITPKY